MIKNKTRVSYVFKSVFGDNLSMNMPRLKQGLIYFLIFVCIVLMSTGIVDPAYEDNPNEPYLVFWLVPPSALVVTLGVLLTWKVLVPRFLMRNRYAVFLLTLFATAYFIQLCGFAIDYFVRDALGLRLHGYDYRSPWLLVFAFISSMMNLMFLSAIALSAMYSRWKLQNKEMTVCETKLKARIKAVRDKLDSINILQHIDKIISLIKTDTDKANSEIIQFSNTLRRTLYAVDRSEPSDKSEIIGEVRDTSWLTGFLTSRHSRAARHILLQIYLLIISLGPCFYEPDKPVFDAGTLIGVAVFDAILNIIVYGNIYLLLPLFLKRGKIKRYFSCVIMASLSLMVTFGAVHYIGTVAEFGEYIPPRPVPLMVVALLNTLFALLTFCLGSAVIVMIQRWLMNNLNIRLLEVETARYRLEYLKKQINPHFLFNILNNIGITIYEDADGAVRMLKELRNILEMQIRDSENATTTIGEELMLLQAYLSLEQTRKSWLRFSIKRMANIEKCQIPTLLLIPFVENAVKFYDRTSAEGDIDIRMEVNRGMFHFECRNPFTHDRKSPSGAGGLGISNTRNRLELLFNGNYKLSNAAEGNMYVVRLDFPLSECTGREYTKRKE